MREYYFLDYTESIAYRDGRYPRSISQAPGDGPPGRQVPLAGQVADFATRRMMADSARGFHCMAVSGRRGDGITWAATEAAAAAKAVLDERPALISGRLAPGMPPEILSLLSRRAVVQAARSSGLHTSVPMPRRRNFVGVVLAVIAITAVAAMLTTLSQQNGVRAGAVALITVTAAVLTVVAQLLINRVKPETTGSVTLALARDAEQQRGTPAYQEFSRLLGVEFAASSLRRCLIVDDFGHLDPITHDVLVGYLSRHTRHSHPELWILFDGCDDPRTGPLRLLITEHQRLRRNRSGEFHHAPLGGRLTETYDLQPLTAAQRAALAEEQGDPARASYLTVKAIVAPGEASTSLALDSLVPTGDAEPDRYRFAALELLYLLGLDATTQGKVLWAEHEILDTFVGERVRSGSLRRLLTAQPAAGDPLTKGRLKDRVRDLQETFGSWTARDDAGEVAAFRVDPHVGGVLRNQWQKRGLADPRIGHLFWAIYWDDHHVRTGQDPLWTAKVADHLSLAGPLSDLPAEFADDPVLADVVFDALLRTARQSLKLCRVRQVSRLAELAHLMLQERGFATPKRAQRLRRVVRDAYGVLGEDRLLPLLVALDAGNGRVKGGRPAGIGDSLAYLFFASLNGGRQATAGTATVRTRRSPALHRYAEVRGAWLALTLLPFTVPATGALTAATRLALTGMDRLGGGAVHAVEAVQSRPQSWSGADFITLSLSLWCWALAGDRRRRPVDTASPDTASPDAAAIAEALVSAYLIADRLRDRRFRRDGTDGLDFVLDGLAEELVTVTAVCALTVLARWPREALAAQRDTLEEVLTECLTELNITVDEDGTHALIRTETAEALQERMALLAVTWGRLGFDHLAGELKLRAAQFALVHEHDEAAAVADLADQLRRGGLPGLLSNVIVAEHAVLSEELSAEMVLHAVRAALAGRMSPDLCAELCLFGLMVAHAFEADFADFVTYLLRPVPGDFQPVPGGFQPEPGSADSCPLARQLSAARGKTLEGMAMALLNVASTHPDLAGRIQTLLRERLAAGTDGDQASDLASILDLAELQAAVRRNAPPPADEVLATWADRRHVPLYANALHILAGYQSELDEKASQEITRVLRSWSDYRAANGMVLLAYRVLRRTARGELPDGLPDRSFLVETLRDIHRLWEQKLGVDTNLDMLGLLMRHDQAHLASYRGQHGHWVKVQLELDEQRKLPKLIDEGLWALLFLDYCNLFVAYGLPLSDDHPPMTGRLDGGRLASETARLAEAGAAPVVATPAGQRISTDFIRDARLLFDSQLSGEQSLAEARRLYNGAARLSIPNLYAMLDALDTVPAGIKTILRRHRSQVVDRIADQ